MRLEFAAPLPRRRSLAVLIYTRVLHTPVHFEILFNLRNLWMKMWKSCGIRKLNRHGSGVASCEWKCWGREPFWSFCHFSLLPSCSKSRREWLYAQQNPWYLDIFYLREQGYFISELFSFFFLFSFSLSPVLLKSVAFSAVTAIKLLLGGVFYFNNSALEVAWKYCTLLITFTPDSCARRVEASGAKRNLEENSPSPLVTL